MIIVKQDSNGVKPLLQVGEFGYDNYPAGGDVGRVYIGTGTENIQIAKRVDIANYAYSKAEVDSLVVEGIVDDAAISLTTAWSSAKVSSELSDINTELSDISSELANLDISPLLKPVITNPVNGTIDFIGNITATYSTSESYAGMQDWVRWEASTDSNFTTLVDSYEGSSNLTSWVPMIGLALTDIYVRTKQGSDGHRSKYSDAVKFTTPDIYVTSPTLTVEGSPSSVTLTPVLSGSMFNVFNGSDTHISTDWKVLKASDSSVVWESLNDTVNLLSIVPSQLPKNTDLIFMVRYNGVTYGPSEWAEVTAKTLNIYVKNPTLAVAGSPASVTLTPLLTGSTFEIVNGTDTHISSDWRVVRSDNGTTVWESLGNTVNKTSINTGQLPKNTDLVFKVRYNSSMYGLSDWVEVSAKTLDIYVENPTLTVSGSPDNVTLSPTLTGSAFSVYNGTDTHVSTDYRVVKVSDNSVAFESLNNTSNKTSLQVTGLSKTTAYKFMIRYNSSIYGSSAWVEVVGTTLDIYVVTPTLTVQGYPTSIGKNPSLTTSAFTVYNGIDTHLSSDYQVLKNSDGSVVWESLGNTSDKLTINSGALVESTEYRFRARHNSTNYGSSAWVEVIGTTKAQFAPAGIAGTKGFSVAPTNEPFAVLGLAKMVGTDVEGHDNYGNYIHTNGSVVCWLPKMYYRVGSPDSPRFATYGGNALDMVSINEFATEAEANASGYALHRCFINGGKEQPGVFVDKYVNSKDGSTKSKSVFGGVPISLYQTSSGLTVSAGMTGCTGILADAVVLSRARGSRWNCISVFIYGYLALVSVAQAQAATSTADVAWYDPTGVKNYPKGCNNNALSDADDTTVKYASAGDSAVAAKPKTGATANFAKTTHNGSNNGVADLNGVMYEVAIGITNFGSSATATTAISDDTIYVLKHSTDIATLTGGWNGATDVWGNAANLATKYDVVTSPHPLGSSTGAVYWGNGTNAVLQNDLSGVNRDVCGFIPKNSNSTSASGVNLFGTDQFVARNTQNMLPLVCGFSGKEKAGVFERIFHSYRTNGGYDFGFRASAYFA